MAGNAPIKEENKRQWIAAMKQNPDHLGLYVMLRWNKRLHGLLVSDSTLLRCATAGIKTLIQYSSSFKRLPGSATAGRHTPVTTTYSLLEDPALSKSEPRQMPAFADIAYAVSTLVSWVCEQAGLADVNTDMARFEPLYAAGYHLDLCKIVAMGNKQVSSKYQEFGCHNVVLDSVYTLYIGNPYMAHGSLCAYCTQRGATVDTLPSSMALSTCSKSTETINFSSR